MNWANVKKGHNLAIPAEMSTSGAAAPTKSTCYCPEGTPCDPQVCVKKYWYPGSPVVESSSALSLDVGFSPATPAPFNYLPEECPAQEAAVSAALEAGASVQQQERAPDPLQGMPVLKLERAAGGVSRYIPSAEKDERLIQLEARLLGQYCFCWCLNCGLFVLLLCLCLVILQVSLSGRSRR